MNRRSPGAASGAVARHLSGAPSAPALPGPALPVDAVLGDLLAALATAGAAVLQAPPGSGKTTRVPLALLGSGLVAGRVLMLEPRRLAARAAAERMAQLLGEPPGRTIGYRMRGDSCVSARTRVEVVTEGILTRMLQRDPGLAGVGTIIFDEFHERSLQADLGLALALDARAALRPDLQLVVMSATLESAPVATLIGGPTITCDAHIHPVETRWLERPRSAAVAIERAVADAVLAALGQTEGGILAFLPGEGEIRRTEAILRQSLPMDAHLFPLFGALAPAAQRRALAPVGDGCKVVLATAIAETSLTISGIRAVVDCGLTRRARFDPGSGMSRLVTERVSRAEADQRRGRAGRVAPGICWRLWTRGEEGALAAHAPAGIEIEDLAGLALELADWGAEDLPFLTPPAPAALGSARALLSDLGALDQGRITPHGRRLATLPVHPRLAHMLVQAGPAAAPLAALLEGHDPRAMVGADLGPQLAALSANSGATPGPESARLRAEAARLARATSDVATDNAADRPHLSAGQMAALAYPDRIALRRPGKEPRFLLSNGRGAWLDPADTLGTERLLVVTDSDGKRPDARIRLALPISEPELRAVLGDRIRWQGQVTWSARDGRVLALREERLGALVLERRPWRDAPGEAVAAAALVGLRSIGLHWTTAARRLAARAARVAELPRLDDEALLGGSVLLPWLAGRTTAADLAAIDLLAVLEALLGPDGLRRLDAEAPASFVTPLGRRVAIDYAGDLPAIELRLQELFGVTRHPCVGGQPLQITLLSPAGRPLQVTTDIAGFWAGSYAEVRKEMRGRYPRHPWPEDPTRAEPTLRAKPRGS